MKKYTTLGKKNVVALLFTLILSFQLISCQKEIDNQRDYPRVKTLDVVNIDSTGATFRGEFISLGTSPVEKCGFVWGRTENLNIGNHDYIEANYNDAHMYFEARIVRSMEANKEYYVRSFAKANGKVIYGEVNSFISLGSEAPEIYEFEPRLAAWGDTIIIRGKNFSNVAVQTNLFFGGTKMPINDFVEKPNDSIIVATIPFDLAEKECNISVDILGNSRQFKSYPFKLILPTVTDFSPKFVRWGDTLTITGTNINNPQFKVSIGDFEAKGISILDRSTIELLVPDEVCTAENSVVMNFRDISISANDILRFHPPTIDSIVPPEASWGEEVTLYGKFHRLESLGKIYFNTAEAPFESHSRDSVIVKVPSDLVSQNQEGDVSIVYKANGVEANNGFMLSGPEIESFSPAKGISGTEITVQGNFAPGITKFYFGDVEVKPSYIANNYLKVVLPALVSGKVMLIAKVGEQQAVSEELFEATNPKILDFHPKTAGFGDEITLVGEYLDADTSETIVRFTNQGYFNNNPTDGPIALIKSISSTSLTLVVPDGVWYEYDRISLQVGNVYQITEDVFSILPPIISSFSPTEGVSDTEFTIIGNNFANSPYANTVTIGGRGTEIITNERNKIVARLTTMSPKLTRGNYKVTVGWGDLKTESSETYTCYSPWKLINSEDYSQYFITQGFTFTYGDNAYIYIPMVRFSRHYVFNRTLYTFSPASNSLESYVLPVSPGINSTYFSYENNIFEVSGSVDSYGMSDMVYSYNIESKEWTQQNNFPGEKRIAGFSFSFSDKAYIGGGDKQSIYGETPLNDLWEYIPSEDGWIQKNSIPFDATIGKFNTAVVNGKGYIFLYDGSVWEYNPQNDEWIEKADFPGGERYFATCFAVGNIVYYGTGRTDQWELYGEMSDLWAYDTETDTWLEKGSTPTWGISETSSFSINGKGYMGYGRHNYWGYYRATDFYEYDPTLEP